MPADFFRWAGARPSRNRDTVRVRGRDAYLRPSSAGTRASRSAAPGGGAGRPARQEAVVRLERYRIGVDLLSLVQRRGDLVPRRLRLRRHRLGIRMARTKRILRSLSHPFVALPVVVLAALAVTALAAAQSAPAPGDRPVAAVLGDTPMVEDLRVLTDEIGGRAPRTGAPLKAGGWGPGRVQGARGRAPQG